MLADTVPLQVQFEEAVVRPQQVSQLHHTAPRHVVPAEVEGPDAATPGHALEAGVAGYSSKKYLLRGPNC